jgi:chemotaxis protein histidine kinase CheA
VNIAKDAEVGRKVFQILHTMKSNAQMHNLKGLADAIHTTESTVSVINDKVAANSPVDPSEVQSLGTGVNSVIQEISKSLKKVA